jgi:two-component system, NtrC family, response regulator AtoC
MSESPNEAAPTAGAARVLVAAVDESLRRPLCETLAREGYVTAAAADGEEALTLYDEQGFDYVLCEERMPRLDGFGLLAALAGRTPAPILILMSANGSPDSVLGAIRRGAYDCVRKPFAAEDLLLALRKAEERERLRRSERPIEEVPRQEPGFANILGRSPRMLEIFATVRKIADYKTTVLVTGESGTGKELIARALHVTSQRRDKPFVAVNCGAIPSELLESELFGHVKGSFTDAVRDKKGLFELAHTGTLFLDEIGELPLALQVKLLRALQEEEIRRVGSSQPTRVDVRIVAATAKDLLTESREGRFRDDLYYRLNVLSLKLPPLRERGDDIPLLIERFLEKHSRTHGIQRPLISEPALRLLLSYRWPGNVRELENTIERAMILAEETITPEDLPANVAAATAVAPPVVVPSREPEGDESRLSMKQRVRSLEESLIRRALEQSNSNRTRAAKLLDISHRTLLYKMQEYGIR